MRSTEVKAGMPMTGLLSWTDYPAKGDGQTSSPKPQKTSTKPLMKK
jgi:hypothetical protein